MAGMLEQFQQFRFQSTLPRRERHFPGAAHDGCRDFNPRSREGSDKEQLGSPLRYAISIHAPAKGATAFINIFSLTVRLFLFHLTNKI